MKRRKDEVPGFSSGDGDAHGLWIPHFANYNNVGSLPQGRSEGGGKIRSVNSNLHLLDYALDMCVFVFDRIFDDDDMSRVMTINLINQSCEGRGFSRTGGASDEN